ncbi:Uncharacterised protein [Yersinia enterocolitica]|nr:Uncharacterised protein [Yersinia enterocolitica]
MINVLSGALGFTMHVILKVSTKLIILESNTTFFTMKLLSYVIVGMYILRIARRNRLDF